MDMPQQPQPVDRSSAPAPSSDGLDASINLWMMPFAGDE